MDVREFDFDLPSELIAQEPAAERSGARVLHLGRHGGSVSELPDLLRSGDLVVVNNTKVFPARLLGHRVPSGGAVECLLVRKVSAVPDTGAAHNTGAPVSDTSDRWEALMHPGQKLKPGAR